MPWKDKTNGIVCDCITKVCRVFKSDGCTLAPDFNFRPCCDDHDYDYSKQCRTRIEADKALRDCIKKAGHPVKAHIYYIGVRLFGGLFWYRKRRNGSDRLDENVANDSVE